MIHVTIPGEPMAQGRPRATTTKGGHVHVYDPPTSKSWKGMARHLMAQALADSEETDAYIASGPVSVWIVALHSCPKSDYRKRQPQPERWRDKRPDIDQIAKAVLDAATGVLWADDAQVATLGVEQVTAAQGEAPRVDVYVERLNDLRVHQLEGRHVVK